MIVTMYCHLTTNNWNTTVPVCVRALALAHAQIFIIVYFVEIFQQYVYGGAYKCFANDCSSSLITER